MVQQEGIQITESGKFHVSHEGTLSIQDLGVADQGRYECIARNPFGFTSSAMQLTITGRVSPAVLHAALALVQGGAAPCRRLRFEQITLGFLELLCRQVPRRRDGSCSMVKGHAPPSCSSLFSQLSCSCSLQSQRCCLKPSPASRAVGVPGLTASAGREKLIKMCQHTRASSTDRNLTGEGEGGQQTQAFKSLLSPVGRGNESLIFKLLLCSLGRL